MEQLLILAVTMLGQGAFEYLRANDFEAAKKLWSGIEKIAGKGNKKQQRAAVAGLVEGMARDRASAATTRTMRGKRK